MGLMAIAATQAGCRPTTAEGFRIAFVKGMLPGKLVGDLKHSLMEEDSDPQKLILTSAKSFAHLFGQLQAWQTAGEESDQPPVADWVCLNDAWLPAAIDQNLIYPFPKSETLPQSMGVMPWRSRLQATDSPWAAPSGSLWAAPYRWGHLMLVYPQRVFQRLGWQPRQWEDLWHSDLAGRILLPNHPRLVLGLVLKAMGHSVNTPDLGKHEAKLQARLAAIAPQVKAYTSQNYLEPLLMEDAWLSVGWSTEIRAVLTQYPQLEAVTPTPGTLLSADVWVKPRAGAKDATIRLSPLDQKWLAHWWKPEVSAPLSLFSNGLAPSLLPTRDRPLPPTEIPAAKIHLPAPEILQNSEFVLPLEADAIAQYDSLWRTLRSTPSA